MGISLMLPKEAKWLTIIFTGSKYTHVEKQNENRMVHLYKRSPFSIPSSSQIGDGLGTKMLVSQTDLGVELTLTLRSVLSDGSKLVTVSAQNISKARQKGIDQSISALFQCKLVVSSDLALLPIYQNRAIMCDVEEKISRLQYRNVVNYAYGHGCSTYYSETTEGVFMVPLPICLSDNLQMTVDTALLLLKRKYTALIWMTQTDQI